MTNETEFLESLEAEMPVSEPLADARRVVAGIAVRVQADKKAAFAPDVIAALRLLKEQDRGEYVQAIETLKACGVSVQEVKSEVSKSAKLRVVAEGETMRRLACDYLPNAPISDLVIPGEYRISEDGSGGYELLHTSLFGSEVVAHCAPFITGRTEDIETRDCGIRVSWSRGNGFSHHVFNRGDLFNARKIVEFAGIGYPVTSNNGKLQVDYFAEMEAANLMQLPKIKTTSHLGWQGRDRESFLIGRELIRGNGESVETQIDLNSMDWPADGICFRSNSSGHDQILAGFRREGSLESWTEILAVAANYPRVLLGVYASLASVCLPIFDCPSFIVDFCSRTSQGKTTLQRLAASAWGDPNENKTTSALLTWNQTKVSVERRLAVLKHLPLLLDDTKKAADVRQIPAIIYSHSGGQGKGRGSLTGVQAMLTWHNVLISSGEQPLTSYSNDGGAVMRVLEIEGAPFGRQDIETGEIVKKINSGACQNFGHAGAEFIRWLVRNREHWDAWKSEYQRRSADYLERAASEKAGRLADYAAAIAQAAILFHTALDLPFPYADPLETLWAEISGEADDPLGAKRALRYVLSWAASNEHRFFGRELDVRTAPNGGWLGRWDQGDDEPIAIYPHQVEDVIRSQKFNPEAIFGEWRERGWLDVKAEDKRFTKQIRVNRTERARMIVLTSDALKIDS